MEMQQEHRTAAALAALICQDRGTVRKSIQLLSQHKLPNDLTTTHTTGTGVTAQAWTNYRVKGTCSLGPSLTFKENSCFEHQE